jgi:hypothetical protein
MILSWVEKAIMLDHLRGYLGVSDLNSIPQKKWDALIDLRRRCNTLRTKRSLRDASKLSMSCRDTS